MAKKPKTASTSTSDRDDLAARYLDRLEVREQRAEVDKAAREAVEGRQLDLWGQQ